MILTLGLACKSYFFFFNDTATTEIYTLSLHDALPIYNGKDAQRPAVFVLGVVRSRGPEDSGVTTFGFQADRSEEHTSELQSLAYLVCRLLLEKKKKEEIL